MITVGPRPLAPAPGASGSEAPEKERPAEAAARAPAEAAPTQQSDAPQRVVPPTEGTRTDAATARPLPTELLAPQPPVADDEAQAQPRPAEDTGRLQSFAQIPTEVMQEISRLRQEAAESKAQGVPGRNDPTPMPASPEAIGQTSGPGAMPYDTA